MTGPAPAIPRHWWSLPSPSAPGPGVLDVGCGTGIAARQFQAAGCRVLGVDPDPRMADLARQSGFGVEVTTFEAWDPVGRAFDAVIARRAWHWAIGDSGRLPARPPGGTCGRRFELSALPGKGSACELAAGEVLVPRQPVQGAAVAPHHVGAVVGVDLGEQGPPSLLSRYPAIMRVPAAQRGHGYLPFHWTLNRVRVTPDLMAGTSHPLSESPGERGIVDGMA
jgi:SAM-dependent methyltransferase